MSSISGISSSSNAWAALSTQRSQHQAKMFAKVDTDGSGGVDPSELSSMLSDISAKTGTSLGDSKELFSKMDSNGDGSLSSDELDKGMKDLMPPPPPPAGGPGGAEGASAASKSSSTSSSSTSYDPLDINQDGTVSDMERLAGALKDLAQATQSDSAGDSSSSSNQSEISKLAQKLYEQISSSLLSSSSSSSNSNSGGQLSATA